MVEGFSGQISSHIPFEFALGNADYTSPDPEKSDSERR